jgi:hypothetical protein
MTTREARLDMQREFRVLPQEAEHYRSDLEPGDIVRGKYGNLARLTGWNHTWSHVRGGRIAHLEPIVAYPGTDAPEGAHPYAHTSSWESDLTRAQPGDVGAHSVKGTVGMWEHRSQSW